MVFLIGHTNPIFYTATVWFFAKNLYRCGIEKNHNPFVLNHIDDFFRKHFLESRNLKMGSDTHKRKTKPNEETKLPVYRRGANGVYGCMRLRYLLQSEEKTPH